MAGKLALLLVPLLFLGAFPGTARSQAAAEYGMAAGAAAAAVEKAATAVKDATAIKDTTKPSGESKDTAKPAAEVPQATPNPPAPVATKPLAAVMKENKEKLEAQALEGGANLRIEPLPAKATVYVDGAVVGYTPFEGKLAPGQHRIEVKHFDSMPWSKEISLKKGETLALKPELQFKKYPSVVTLSAE